MTNISYITIGTELLKGRIVNTNAAKAGVILRKHGFQLNRVLSIHDTQEAILDAVSQELEKSEIVLISGGLGPTKDDITKHTLAGWAGMKLVWHEPTLASIEQRYALRGRTLNPLTRAQAKVPEGCRVIPNHMGTAPGMCFPKDGKLVFSMPGVPFEMLHMLQHEVLPVIQEQFETGTFRHTVIRLANLPESEVATRMEPLEAEFPDGIEVAYLPRVDGLWVELSLRLSGNQGAYAEEVLQKASDQIVHLFGNHVYATNEEPLPTLLVDFFLTRNLTLSLVEQTSGGAVVAKLYEVSEVGQVLKGILMLPEISEDRLNTLFEEFAHETSEINEEQLALALAKAVRKRFKTDVGIATVGPVEKQGEEMAEVWIGYADSENTNSLHRSLLYDRKVNLERTSYYAMQFCLDNARQHFA